MPELIRNLFSSDITRRIEEVIKVDQTNEEIIRDEIDEYVVTDVERDGKPGVWFVSLDAARWAAVQVDGSEAKCAS